MIHLEPNEQALGCATGRGWVSVLTSKNYLRVFSTGGAQDVIWHVPGPALTMVGRENCLALVHHQGSGLAYTLWDMDAKSKIASGSLAPGVILHWIGMDNDLSLFLQTSDHVLYMLSSLYGWNLVPTLDLKTRQKTPTDSFWPLWVQDGSLTCVPLHGGDEHPDPMRNHLPSTISLKMPLLIGTLGKVAGALEDMTVRAGLAVAQRQLMSLFENDLDETNILTQIDKLTLKLYIKAIEQSRVEAALDLTKRLYMPKSMEVAIKMAERANQLGLMDEATLMMNERFPIKENEETDEFSEEEEMDSDVEVLPTPPSLLRSREADNHDHHPSKKVRMDRFPKQTLSDEVSFRETPLIPEKLIKFNSKNPFAKKLVESPAQKPALARVSPSPSGNGTTLKRQSTFSAASRKREKEGKTLI